MLGTWDTMGCSVHSELLKTELIDVPCMSNTYKKLKGLKQTQIFFKVYFD